MWRMYATRTDSHVHTDMHARYANEAPRSRIFFAIFGLVLCGCHASGLQSLEALPQCSAKSPGAAVVAASQLGPSRSNLPEHARVADRRAAVDQRDAQVDEDPSPYDEASKKAIDWLNDYL